MLDIKESFYNRLETLREEYKDVKIGHSTGSYKEHDDHIEIASVRTPQKHRGQGGASEVMKHINKLADEKKKKVRLLASPLDKKTRTDKLVGFYRKHGYETTGKKGNAAGDPWMERNPK
jgi:predicted GNAT family acetyltransferase